MKDAAIDPDDATDPIGRDRGGSAPLSLEIVRRDGRSEGWFV
jgi:hypothetical protein